MPEPTAPVVPAGPQPAADPPAVTDQPAVARSAEATSVEDALPSNWSRTPPTARGRRADMAIAAALLLATACTVQIYAAFAGAHQAPGWVDATWVVLICVPLALRRRFPATVAGVVSVAFIMGQLVHVPEYLFSQICVFMALYTLGAWGQGRRRSVVVRALIVSGMFIWLVVALVLTPQVPAELGGGRAPYGAYAALTVLINLLYFGGAVAFGEGARVSARRLEALQQRTSELSAERERTAQQAVALERVRIARELHDVVAHHVSVMGVQASAARLQLPTAPDQAVAALGSIEVSARSAVDEMHRLLHALRRDDEGADLPRMSASTVGIDGLPDLAREAAEAGTPVTVRVIGEPRAVPPTTGLTAYRVAQEALTNVRKHAGVGAVADLRLRYLADAIEVEVGDHDGAGGGAGGGPSTGRRGAGLGQLGMRERVAAVGGTLEAGPSRSGYLVRARLPLPAHPTP